VFDLRGVGFPAWTLAAWSTWGGRFSFSGFPPMSLLNQFCASLPPGQGKPSVGTLEQCLGQHGYTQWTSYQPASRFWPFQWIEGGWLPDCWLMPNTGGTPGPSRGGRRKPSTQSGFSPL
jgi:hypothetical protein